MNNSSDKWFRYLRENVRIDEGLRDIGLSENIIDAIEHSLQHAPESAKTWLGMLWKKTHAHQFIRPAGVLTDFVWQTEHPLYDLYDYETGGIKPSEAEEPLPEVQFEGVLNEIENWDDTDLSRIWERVPDISGIGTTNTAA